MISCRVFSTGAYITVHGPVSARALPRVAYRPLARGRFSMSTPRVAYSLDSSPRFSMSTPRVAYSLDSSPRFSMNTPRVAYSLDSSPRFSMNTPRGAYSLDSSYPFFPLINHEQSYRLSTARSAALFQDLWRVGYLPSRYYLDYNTCTRSGSGKQHRIEVIKQVQNTKHPEQSPQGSLLCQAHPQPAKMIRE